MITLRVLLSRLRGLIGVRARDRELSEEIEAHLDMLAREHMQRGMSEADARAAARRAFGGIETVRETYRDQSRLAWASSLAQDVRFGVRLLARDRRFTFGAVIALALGISVNNMMFTFVNAVMFRDLPLEKPQQLVGFNTRDARGRRVGVSYPDFNDWRSSSRSFSFIVARAGREMNVSDEGRAPERFVGGYITPEAFGMYGVKPVLGRGLEPADDAPGASPVAVLSDRAWASRYASDPHIIGHTIRVNGVPSTVVGIIPGAVKSPLMGDQVWQPLRLAPGVDASKRDARTLNVDGRLKDDVTLEQARAELTAIGTQLARDYPETNRDVRPAIAPLDEVRRAGIAPLLATLMAAVGFVLLIACANVANLLLARSADRSREVAIRASLGATRWRLVRQLLIESLVLAFAGGLLGLLLSVYFVRLFSFAFAAKEIGGTDMFMPYWLDLSMNWRVFAFLAAICLGSSVIFGLAPAFHLSKVDVHEDLKDGGRGAGVGLRARRWTDALMIGELALAVVLVAGAGLLVRSVIETYRAGRVFDTSDLVTMRFALPAQTYATTGQRKAFLERFDQRLASSASIASATLASNIPFVPGGARRAIAVDGGPPVAGGDVPTVSYLYIDTRYFQTLGVRLLRGRDFNDLDGASGEDNVIVNQRLAATFFPGIDPVGRRIQLTNAAEPRGPASSFTIVGVAPIVPQFQIPNAPGRAPDSVVYAPLRGEPAPAPIASVIVRGRSGPAAAASQVREELRQLDPDLPVYFVRTMDDAAAEMGFQVIGMTRLLGLFAGIAFFLAAVGLYGITAHAVTQRTSEIGVRMALGARAGQVVWLFLRRTIVQVVVGVLLGVAGALAVGKVIQGLLVQTSARDPVTLVFVAALLAIVSVAACLIPARRAARLDPAVTLRYE